MPSKDRTFLDGKRPHEPKFIDDAIDLIGAQPRKPTRHQAGQVTLTRSAINLFRQLLLGSGGVKGLQASAILAAFVLSSSPSQYPGPRRIVANTWKNPLIWSR